MINVEKEKWQAMGELWVKSTQGLTKLPALANLNSNMQTHIIWQAARRG